MKFLRSLAMLGFLVAILLGVLGLFWTRDSTQSNSQSSRRQPPVDESPLQTAQQMAKLVSSWDEQRLAQQALKLADHEVDLAFAGALRDAAEQPRSTKPESRNLYNRVSK